MVFTRTIWVAFPDKIRIATEYIGLEPGLYVCNGNKTFTTRPRLSLTHNIGEIIAVLAGIPSPRLRLVEEKSGIATKIDGKKCFLTTFSVNPLMQDLFTKIICYIEYDSLRFLKLEIFARKKGTEWRKIVEIYATEWEKLEEIMGWEHTRSYVSYFYPAVGEISKIETKIYSIKFNQKIDESLFKIPEKSPTATQ